MGRGLVVAVAAGILGWSCIATGGNQLAPPTHPAAQAAQRYFESVRNRDFETFLRELRQPPPPPAIRALILENLPPQGGLSPTDRETAKLAAIRPLLRLHEREDSIDLRLFTYGGGAFTGLHARSVLLISRETLGLLNTDELVAIFGHELGHDYFWDEFEQARQQADNHRLQELELRCDGIAVIAMARLGVDPDRLISALRKLVRHNERQRTPYGPNEPRYAPLEQRARFVRAMAMLTAGSPRFGPR
jgi:Zn-dependent protease with chaperone function